MKMREKTHELPFHVVKRDTMPFWKSMTIRIVAVVAALLLCSVLSVFMINANPFEFIETMIDGVLGSSRRLWKFAKDASVLLCIALAVTPAFRMRFWNIGAEGQTLIGALASVGALFSQNLLTLFSRFLFYISLSSSLWPRASITSV